MRKLGLGKVRFVDDTIGAFLTDLTDKERGMEVFVPADVLRQEGVRLTKDQLVEFEEDTEKKLDRPIAKSVRSL